MSDDSHTPPKIKDEELKLPSDPYINSTQIIEKSRFMPILLGTLVLLLVIVLIGLYFWHQSIISNFEDEPTPTRPTAEENNEPESTTAEAVTQAQDTTSPSDNLNSIEADLESTNFTNIDGELVNIENEIKVELGE